MRINDIKDTNPANAEQASAHEVEANRRRPAAGDGRKGKSAGMSAAGDRQAKFGKPGETKSQIVLKKLQSAKGATIAMLVEATGRQAHSVRGFLSGTVKKKLGLALVAETGKDGARRYRIGDTAKAG